MPAPFKQISREQFAELLAKFPFKRKINAVHMHHTWRPNRNQYKGHDTIVSMWRFHTQENHWSDIAQHITIAPDGTIWLGRDWNMPPASASGHNGNAQAGPFMFEMIGDFDEGKDPFDGEQRKTALEVITRVQLRFGLPPGTLQLHKMMSTKSCPGTSIDYQTVLHEVSELHPQLISSGRAAPPPDGPFSPEQQASRQFVHEAIEDLQRSTGRAIDPADAEPCSREAADDHGHEGRAPRARGIAFDAADLHAMRPHIVNLRMGHFSSTGDWSTSPQDVDAIFEQHLPAALKQAQTEGRHLRVMFYAHGGLNGEADALAAARDRIGWWKSNGIYPIHFIWETGLAEVLGQMLERWQQGRGPAPRNLFSDHVSDPLIESFAHRAGGVQIWSSMKWSAMQASSPNVLGGDGNASGAVAGGAYYVAEKLAAFCKAHRDDVEVHAAGHSAGAIFHAHFLPCALDLGMPQVHSLHLLAPAVRVDLFKQQLAPRVGRDKGIAQLALYTMADSYEKDDSCGGVYRKSLLYLIYRGLEPERDEAVLGLERSIRADGGLKLLFGIGADRGSADVVWSDNGLDHGRSATRSHTHGGFDDDPATMGSVVRRVLGKADADRIIELPASAARSVDPWRAPVDYWSDAMPGQWSDGFADGWSAASRPQSGAPMQPPFTAPSFVAPAMPPQRPMSGAGGGRRLALCVGIDNYPTAPLGGCVNDARDWADALARLGFAAPRSLYNQNATRDAIMRQLTALVGDSRPGDVIVFQYAGHGTTVPDLDGDEAGGDTPGDDEALCPYDFASGELLIDDDMRAIFGRLPAGVNLTCFFDCCHSGTITRMALGGRPGVYTPGKRPRFVHADAQLIEKYAARRYAAPSRAVPASGIETMREVVFSACLSNEVALESDGHGDFTLYAMQVLGQDVAGLSNGDFADRVTQAFGPSPRQHAKLYSSDAGRALALLQPLGVADASRGRAPAQDLSAARELSELAAQLARASQRLAQHH